MTTEPIAFGCTWSLRMWSGSGSPAAPECPLKAGRVSTYVHWKPEALPVHVGAWAVGVNDEPQQILWYSGAE
jgi:hypothetical protein